MMFVLPIQRMSELFAAIHEKNTLYLPIDDGCGQSDFHIWQEGSALSNRYNTANSIKDFFFPQTENLVDFKVSGKKIEIFDPRKECEDFVLFGVRACDLRSLDILDRVFLSEPVDTYYQNRRAHATIITLACTRPQETCFCTTFEIDPADPKGDVSSWIVGEELFLRANTAKGEALLQSVSELLQPSDDCLVKEQQTQIRRILEKLPLAALDLTTFRQSDLLSLFESEKWRQLSEYCLGCGCCTFVCPTCQCYDIRDFDNGHGVNRYRCWDSCMYSDFTRMAHGNPRLTQTERFRQRFMHKLVYYPSKNEGIFGCVGCGRCIAKCPISMNIAKVIKALGETNA